MSKQEMQGIYIDETYIFNWKCVVLGFGLVAAYWLIPRNKNILLLPLIFTIGYVLMGVYDYHYDCKDTLFSSANTKSLKVLDSLFKPQRRAPAGSIKPPPGKRFVSDQEAVYRKYMYMFHILIVTPILTWIGFRGKKAHPWLFQLLVGIALLALGYHGTRLIYPRPEQSRSIYGFHTFIIAPLLFYIGIKGNKTPQVAFQTLLGFGAISGAYHGIRYFTPKKKVIVKN